MELTGRHGDSPGDHSVSVYFELYLYQIKNFWSHDVKKTQLVTNFGLTVARTLTLSTGDGSFDHFAGVQASLHHHRF